MYLSDTHEIAFCRIKVTVAVRRARLSLHRLGGSHCGLRPSWYSPMSCGTVTHYLYLCLILETAFTAGPRSHFDNEIKCWPYLAMTVLIVARPHLEDEATTSPQVLNVYV